MGNDTSKNKVAAQKQKLNQQQVLKQATKIVECNQCVRIELKLFENSNQIRQQRHLFARILIHGHSNLIMHLRKFNKNQQKQILHYLKFIDYQTTDLLYQNLILNGMKQQKKKIDYVEYHNFKDKSKELIENKSQYSVVQGKGEELLSNKKVAILIFAGGMSSRFKNKQNQIIPKQFYTSKQDQKCLLQIALDKAIKINDKYPKTPFYLVHNEINNSKKLKQILSKYSELNIKKLISNQNPIINLSGKMCIKYEEVFQILTAPRGCGDLANLSIKGVKFFEQMKKQGIQYVFTMGIQNILAQIADPYLVGTLASRPDVSIVFKCTYPDNQSQNLKRVVFNSSKSCLQANQLENLLVVAQKDCFSFIRRSPVWANNVVFRLNHIQQYFENKKANFNISSVFSQKKIQCTYWNPSTNSYNQLQHCYIFERELNNLFLNQDLKSVGVMVERQKQFMPVITLDGQWNWQDAYNQYLYYQSNQNKKIKNQNYFSIAFSQQSQM